MWEELGIAPTKDVRQIRRAYANRLRAIEGDRDGAAFMRLRQAFEAALAWARQGEGHPSVAPERIAADRPLPRMRDVTATAQSAGVAAPDEQGAEAETASALADCRRAIGAGDTEAAFGLVQAASVKGLIPLAEGSEVFAELMALALGDRGLSAERLREMVRWGNWDAGGGADDLRDAVLTRLEGEEWHAGLVAAAARDRAWFLARRAAYRGPGGIHLLKRHQDERADARLFLGLSPRLSYYFATVPWYVELLLARYAFYEPWVGDRFDGKRIGWLRKVTSRPRWKARVIDFFWFRFLPVAGGIAALLAFFGLLIELGAL